MASSPRKKTLFEGFEGALTVPEGTRLPIVPDVKASMNVMYSFNEPIMGGYPYVLVRYTYTGDSVNSLAGIESSPFLSPVVDQDAWTTIDLQAGLEADLWTLSVYVDNVTDEEADLFYNNRFAQATTLGECAEIHWSEFPLQDWRLALFNRLLVQRP